MFVLSNYNRTDILIVPIVRVNTVVRLDFILLLSSLVQIGTNQIIKYVQYWWNRTDIFFFFSNNRSETDTDIFVLLIMSVFFFYLYIELDCGKQTVTFFAGRPVRPVRRLRNIYRAWWNTATGTELKKKQGSSPCTT